MFKPSSCGICIDLNQPSHYKVLKYNKFQAIRYFRLHRIHFESSGFYFNNFEKLKFLFKLNMTNLMSPHTTF